MIRDRRRHRFRIIAVGFAVALGAAGCAVRQPAFEAHLPDRIPATAPAIAVIGDLQLTNGLVRLFRHRENNADAQRRLVDDLAGELGRIGALVIVGDLVYTGSSGSDWRHFDELVAPFAAEVPVLPAIGNHDYHCIFVQICWQSVVPKPYRRRFPWVSPGTAYAVGYGDLRLIFLDSETNIAAQADWLGAELDRVAGSYRMALVFFHRPAFTNSVDRGSRGDVEVAERIVPVLEAAPVPVAVFNGHIHGYEHLLVDGIHFFTTAGGGGPRGPVAPKGPGDVYDGPHCGADETGAVLRPLNYALVTPLTDGVRIDVRGFCKTDPRIGPIESTLIPFTDRDALPIRSGAGGSR